MEQVEELQASLSIKKNELEQKTEHFSKSETEADGPLSARGREEEDNFTGDTGSFESKFSFLKCMG